MPADQLDPLIHQRTRLTILAALHRNREVAFTDLRDDLELTAGNLKSHATRLEEAGYVRERQALTPTGFQMRYRITEEGSRAFQAYLQALEDVLAGVTDGTLAAPDGEPGEQATAP